MSSGAVLVFWATIDWRGRRVGSDGLDVDDGGIEVGGVPLGQFVMSLVAGINDDIEELLVAPGATDVAAHRNRTRRRDIPRH